MKAGGSIACALNCAPTASTASIIRRRSRSRPQICPRSCGAPRSAGAPGHAGRQHRSSNSQAHCDTVGATACPHIVLCGNVHLGAPLVAVGNAVADGICGVRPLGERLAQAITFPESVADSDGIDHFRIVDGDRLMWASPETTWGARPKRFGSAIQRRINTVFPRLGKVAISDVFGGAMGTTVHGMPQVGQLRKGLWVASGFGRHGIGTSAMGGLLLARSILWGDERWRLFSPFELVWAGGPTGRIAGHLIGKWTRGSSAAAGVLALPGAGAAEGAPARGATGRSQRQAGTRAPPRRRPPPGQPRPARPQAPPPEPPRKRGRVLALM